MEEQNLEYWFKKGCDFYDLEQFDEAIKCFYKVIEHTEQ
ncbi:MAG: tetratricopeptide repeat protein, partial [Bacteroidales bacterium]|nr:tetratricopeptide repeat protein [Bacteroidales bacterium]